MMPASCLAPNNDLAAGGCTVLQARPALRRRVRRRPGEPCDLGVKNEHRQLPGTGGCAPGCRFPRRCGDGLLDQTAGEQCDLGDAVNGTAGAACSVICRIPAP